MPTKVYAVLGIAAGAMTLQVISSADPPDLPTVDIGGLPDISSMLPTQSSQSPIEMQTNRRVIVEDMTLEYRNNEPFVLAPDGRWLKVRR